MNMQAAAEAADKKAKQLPPPTLGIPPPPLRHSHTYDRQLLLLLLLPHTSFQLDASVNVIGNGDCPPCSAAFLPRPQHISRSA